MTSVLRNHLRYWLLLVGLAAAVTVLSVLHPDPFSPGTVYQSVLPVVDWWIVLHVLLAVLFALIALALFVSLAHEVSSAATLARAALGVFVVGNCAFIGVDGLATGMLIRGAQTLPAAQQAGVEQALQALWNSPINAALGSWWAGLAWVVAIGATAAALYPQAQRPIPLALLLLSLAVNIGIRAGLSPDTLLPATAGGLLGLVQAVLGLVIIAVVTARGGLAMVPFGLLIFATILPQHGGVMGAVGVASLGVALAWYQLAPAGVAPTPSALTAPAAVA